MLWTYGHVSTLNFLKHLRLRLRIILILSLSLSLRLPGGSVPSVIEPLHFALWDPMAP
jgi:hypothetical protein